jgi:hypothetical protein
MHTALCLFIVHQACCTPLEIDDCNSSLPIVYLLDTDLQLMWLSKCTNWINIGMAPLRCLEDEALTGHDTSTHIVVPFHGVIREELLFWNIDYTFYAFLILYT